MKKPRKKPDEKPRRAGSIKAAAGMLECPPTWISKAKEAGVAAFTANGTVDVDKVKAWIDANAAELEASSDQLSLKEQKLAEQVRQLRLRNDREAGKLVEIAWVAERFQRFAGEINAIRVKSESEDAPKFAETNGDIPRCRSVLRGIWDQIMRDMQACSKHFAR